MSERLESINFKRIGLIVGIALLLVMAVIGLRIYDFFLTDEPKLHADVIEHFKYGSIGSDRVGLPYWIWLVLPDVFPDLLPDGSGEGYERMGFLFESESHQRPIGTSYREKPIPRVGVNCAVCHTGTVRETPESSEQIILGMPANQFDLQSYVQFLFATARDERFNAGTLLSAIGGKNADFSLLNRLFYRFLVIPRLKEGLITQSEDFIWMESIPVQGPGRVDTFALYKVVSGLDDDTVGTVDLPSLWNQRVREGMSLHWDGNNDSVDERNLNAAIGAGGVRNMEDALDHEGINRVAQWIRDLPSPGFPQDKIDGSRVEAGRGTFQTYCAQCHSSDGAYIGQVTDIDEIGTDRERFDSFTQELADRLNTVGEGQPWQFSHFRKTNGYANMPLDGLWLRAPYLHNGSVPTLRDLLNPPEERPKVFYRGYDVYDFDNLGFISNGPEAERLGFKYDITERGNGNQGHEYGTSLSQQEKNDLLEFLKTQ